MISYIKGTISEIQDGYMVLDNQGIGYQIFMTSSSLGSVTIGMESTIHIHMALKEDDISLYGFLSQQELKMFKQLITVSGVGPKGALGIMSALTIDELRLAIISGDSKRIAASKGTGLKTAQKIVVELKDKLKKQNPDIAPSVSGQLSGNADMAIAFVCSTGISRADCLRALEKCENTEGMDVDKLIDTIFMNLSV